MPEDLVFQTKPEIGLGLLKKAVKRGKLPFQWVAADALYGDSPAFRDGIDALGKWYFTEIKTTTPIWRTPPKVHVPKWKGRGRRPTRLRLCAVNKHPLQVKQLVRDIPKKAGFKPLSKKAVKAPLSATLLSCG